MTTPRPPRPHASLPRRFAPLADSPHALALAELASSTGRVDHAVLRELRLLLPDADAIAEADLWFSSLVAVRTANEVVLRTDVLDDLRARLVESGRLDSALGVVARIHESAPPLLRLEDALIRIGLRGAAVEEIEERIGEALETIWKSESRSRDVASWALHALPRLPPTVRTTSAAWSLALTAEVQIGYAVSLGDAPRGAARLSVPLARVAPPASVGIARVAGAVVFGDVVGPTINVPGTTPRIVRVDAGGVQTLVAVPAGGTSKPVALPNGNFEVSDLAGRRWRVGPTGRRIDFDGERQHLESLRVSQKLLARLDQLLVGDSTDRWVLVTSRIGAGERALLATWLRRREQAGALVPHHFLRRNVEGWDDPETLVDSLVAQIEERYPDQREPVGLAGKPPEARLSAMLACVSASELVPRGERLVVLIDGLDEYDPPPDAPPDDPLATFLPRALPRGVSFLCSVPWGHPYVSSIAGRDGELETVVGELVGRALLVGSSDGLSGVDHNVRCVANMLRDRGFEIDIRTGDRATREGILNGYQALIANARPSEAAVFYYAGRAFYGFQESESRSWQGISPVDVGESTDSDFRGITAWELSIKEAQLTQRTKNVTVILDCSSASQTSRGGAIRDAEGPVAVRDAVPRTLPHPVRRGFAAHLRALRANYGSAFDAVDPIGNRNVVRLVACGPGETAFEYQATDGQYTGVFTQALLEVLKEIGDVSVSWAAIEGAIRGYVHLRFPTQRPEIEGPARRRLFSLDEEDVGGAVIIAITSNGLQLNAGRLMGVMLGDVYGVLPSGSRMYREVDAIAEVRVRETFATFANAELLSLKNGHSVLPHNAIAILVEKTAIRRAVRIDVPVSVQQVVTEEIAATPTLRVAGPEEPTVMPTLRLTNGALTIEDPLGPLFSAARYPEELRSTVLNLANFAAAQGLRELEGEHGVLASELELELGAVDHGQMRRLPEHGGALALRDKFYVKIKSRTQRPLYAHIFSLGLRGKITLLTAFAPSGVELTFDDPELVLGRRSDGALLGLGLTWPRGMPREALPRTDEVVVIVTSRRVSLRSLETVERFPGARATGSKLEDLFAQLQDGLSRNMRGTEPLDGFLVKRLSFFLYPRDVPIAAPDTRDAEGHSLPDNPPQTDPDFGVVIGIDDYQHLQSLSGAANDAARFHNWLCDANGGGLDQNNARLILSNPEAQTPVQGDIDTVLQEVLREAIDRGGARRLYFYFSGHGATNHQRPGGDIALLLPRWSHALARLGLSTERYSNALCRARAFKEVVMFIDCDLTTIVSAVGVPPTFPEIWSEGPYATRTFIAYATEREHPAFEVAESGLWQGIFTQCLLSILRRSNGIAANVLKNRLESEVDVEALRIGVAQRAYVSNGLREESRFGRGEESPTLKEHTILARPEILIGSETTSWYIERAVDMQAFRQLSLGKWIYIHGPRRSGRTSLLQHLARRLNSDRKIDVEYVAVSDFEEESAMKLDERLRRAKGAIFVDDVDQIVEESRLRAMLVDLETLQSQKVVCLAGLRPIESLPVAIVTIPIEDFTSFEMDGFRDRTDRSPAERIDMINQVYALTGGEASTTRFLVDALRSHPGEPSMSAGELIEHAIEQALAAGAAPVRIDLRDAAALRIYASILRAGKVPSSKPASAAELMLLDSGLVRMAPGPEPALLARSQLHLRMYDQAWVDTRLMELEASEQTLVRARKSEPGETLVLLLDLAENPIDEATVFTQLPEGVTQSIVLRLTDFGVARHDTGTPDDWLPVLSAIDRMLEAAHAQEMHGPWQYWIAGRAGLPAFFYLGHRLAKLAPVTLVHLPKTGIVDVLPLGLPSPPVEVLRPYFTRSPWPTRPQRSQTWLGLVVSSMIRIRKEQVEELMFESGMAPAEIIEAQAIDRLDERSVMAASIELDECMGGLSAWYPQHEGLAVFIAGPTTLAFLVGRAINPLVFPHVQVFQYRGGSYMLAYDTGLWRPASAPVSAEPEKSTSSRWVSWELGSEDITNEILDAIEDRLIQAVQEGDYPVGYTEIEELVFRNIDEVAGVAEIRASFSAEHPKEDFGFDGHVEGHMKFVPQARDKREFLDSIKVTYVEAHFNMGDSDDMGARPLMAQSEMESPWHAVFVAATQVQHDVLRALLLDAAEQGAGGNLAQVAVAAAGLADALRIHYTRTYRIARGSDAPRLERVLPATLSVPASKIFPGVTDLWSEPVLEEDKYGEVAVARLGFSVEELSIFDRAAQFVLHLADAQGRGTEVSQQPPPPEILAQGLCALAAKLKSLEDTEPAIVRSLAELVAGADAK